MEDIELEYGYITPIIYRNKPYYYEIELSTTYDTMESFVRIYIKRTGFFSRFSRYKLIMSIEDWKKTCMQQSTLKQLLKSAHTKCCLEGLHPKESSTIMNELFKS